MKHKVNAYTSDSLFLSRWNLIQLFFGKELKAGSLIVKVIRGHKK